MSGDDELLRLFLATPAPAPVVAVSADLTSADLPTSAQPLLRAVQLQPQARGIAQRGIKRLLQCQHHKFGCMRLNNTV